MADTVGGSNPFPPRALPTVRVGSASEQGAYLAAYPAADGPWRVVSRVLVTMDGRREEHLSLRSPGGETAVVRFDALEIAVPTTGTDPVALDRLLQTAAEFARENGPHHPGELPRFPVPSERYPGRVEVPLAIVAVDGGRRGLYAPARLVVLSYPDGEPYGVGEFPGFDPEDWPPPRLGDWPPGVRELDPLRLQGMVTRFAACWTRLLHCWFAGGEDRYRADEAAEARALLAWLDPPGMAAVYERLGPGFWRWLGT